jgi:hypothetical protein
VVPKAIAYEGTDYPVTKICNLSGSSLTQLVLPESVVDFSPGALRNTKLKSVSLPEKLTYIPERLFEESIMLEHIYIPASLTSIGAKAFYGCSRLKEINIPKGVSVIEEQTFYSTGLNTITLPEGVTAIGDAAFSHCQLKEITLPKSVTKIASSAFLECKNLKDIYCYAEDVPEVEGYGFYYFSNCTLHVPSSSIKKYAQHKAWMYFLTAGNSIVDIETGTPYQMEQCATPVISFSNGKLTYTCDTEGVLFNTSIGCSDVGYFSHQGSLELTATYNISTYATRSGYRDSERTVATLCWIDSKFDNGIDIHTMDIGTSPILIKSDNGILTIEGTAYGYPIQVYDLEGRLLGTGKTANGTSQVSTPLRKGDCAIVKVGMKSVKITL